MKNFENENIFLSLEIAEIYGKGQFWVRENDFGHKNPFFVKVKTVSGAKHTNLMTCSLREMGISVTSYILN